MFEFKGIEISWLGHDGFKIKDEKVIYIDPFQLPKGGEPADIILVTHNHFDHLSPSDIRRVLGDKTIIVAPEECRPDIARLGVRGARYVRPGDRLELDGILIEAVPAYNVSKFRAPGVVYHPKEDGKVGYVIEIGGVRIYHMGDTDFVPEMKGIKVDVALVPVSGTYVMTAREAAEAVNEMMPEVAIPMHFGSIVGSRRDAEEFERYAKCRVVILERSGP